MPLLEGFGPIGSSEPRILILGSFPSVKSLERGQYYGHGQNQFWPILGSILGFPFDAPYEERVAALARNGIAVWDAIAACEREGSLDQAIRAERPNPIADFVAARPGIARLGLNGGKAFSSFAVNFAPEFRGAGLGIGREAEWRPGAAGRGVAIVRLPSTSPVPTRDYRRAADKIPLWSAFLLAR